MPRREHAASQLYARLPKKRCSELVAEKPSFSPHIVRLGNICHKTRGKIADLIASGLAACH